MIPIEPESGDRMEQRRFILRRMTSHAHESVESAVGTFSTIEDYRRYVSAIYAFRNPIETALQNSSWPAEFGDWRPSYIGRELRNDLIDLGLDRVDQKSEPGRFDDIERFLGTLYVLEGSALGAKLLYQKAQALGFSASFGAQHFAAQTDSPIRWKAFLEILERAHTVDIDKVATISNDVFAAATTSFENVSLEAPATSG
jgi:heme oxygenase (biliverdin-IX-beta and delta-forming)